jgi:hypothetical protein
MKGEMTKKTYIVEPFEVSGLFSEGYKVSGNAVAKRIVDRLNHIKNAVRTRRPHKWGQYYSRPQGEEIVIEAFEAKLNFTAAMRAIMKFFGGGPTTISGEIVAIPESPNPFVSVRSTESESGIALELSVRIQGEPGKTFSKSFSDFDELITRAADYCYEQRGVYYLALFICKNLRNLGKATITILSMTKHEVERH